MVFLPYLGLCLTFFAAVFIKVPETKGETKIYGAPDELREYSIFLFDRWLIQISGRTVEDISRGLQGLAPLVRSSAKYTEVDA